MNKAKIDKIYDLSFVSIKDELFNDCYVFDRYLFAQLIAAEVAIEIATADLKRKEVSDVNPM
mgnify:CR=1 FL=1